MVKNNKHPVAALERQKHIEQKLYDFVDTIDLALCVRCLHNRYKEEKWINHNQGKLSIAFSKNQNVTEQHVNDWTLDAEHGLLHGFLVAFHAYQEILKKHTHEEIMDVIKRGKFEDNWYEKLMASCLLHDFARYTNGEVNHDANLKKYFPELSPDTYTHANPLEETPLVIGDRIELRRFDDWESWINVDIADIDKYTNKTKIEHFYKTMRPALVQLFEGRYEIWLRHGAENRLDFSKGIFPVNIHHELRRQGLDLCCVETGNLYTFTCQNYPNSNCLFDHSQQWAPRGLLRHKIAKKHGYKLMPCVTYPTRDKELTEMSKGRDHLGIEGLKVPLDNWVFFYNYDAILKAGHAKVNDVVRFTNGLEEKLALRILNCTEKIVERIKCLIC